jgi:predicted ATPase
MLKALLAAASPPVEDMALLADLLSLPAEQRYPPLALSPQRKKEKTLEALVRQLVGLSRRQPVLFVCEDLHWIDPSSRELLDRVCSPFSSPMTARNSRLLKNEPPKPIDTAMC